MAKTKKKNPELKKLTITKLDAHLATLERSDLESFAFSICSILFRDSGKTKFNSEKEWDSSTTDNVAEHITAHLNLTIK